MSSVMRTSDDSAASAPLRRPLGQKVPAEGENGVFTQSWYPICLSSAASRRFVRGFDFLDGRVVVVRDEAGRAQVLSAYCPHMGADLSVGDMVDGEIRCVFHHWRYGADGKCRRTAIGDPAPANARLFRFPTLERYGLIWAYNGLEPHYQLPDLPFPDEDLAFKVKPGIELPVDPWIVCANTPDMQHIKTLHGIKFECEDPHDLVQWTDHSFFYEFTGVHTNGTPVWNRVGIVGTTLYYQVTDYGGKWFAFLAPFGMPRPGRSFVYMVVAARKDMGTSAEVGAFLDSVIALEEKVVSEDIHNMLTIHFRPGTLTRSDASLARFFDYLRKFPRAHPSAEFIR
jgi:nitrite reductase/ring-hydroxylating ferredoxin subunit